MSKLTYTEVRLVGLGDWDNLVTEVYRRPYSFQQQDGCQSRGTYHTVVPCKYAYDYENDTVPEEVNGPERGVSFAAWLNRDPSKPLPDRDEKWALELFWERNFYPSIEMVANDLYEKGILEEGSYVIEIDW